MSSEPDVKAIDDVIPWIWAHKAAAHERHEQMREHQRTTDRSLGKIDERVSRIERTCARWAGIASLVGAAGGTGLALFARWLIFGGAPP